MFEVGMIIAVIIAFTEFVKRVGLHAKYLPAVSLVSGILAGLFYVDAPTIQEKIIYGLMIGLSAAGLFDQSKIVTKKGDQ